VDDRNTDGSSSPEGRRTSGLCVTGPRLGSTMRTRTLGALLPMAVVVWLLLGVGNASAGAGGPVNTGLPSISGKARDGSKLAASVGTWQGLTPMTFSYQWMLCDGSGGACSEIEGAEQRTYLLGHEDVGRTLRVVVTATSSEGTASSTSAATKAIAPLAPSRVTLPAVSGTPQDGKLVTALDGTWKGTPPLAFSYQWKSCVGTTCSVILGATESTYRPTTSELGQSLRVLVTAANVAGSKAASSRSSAKLVPGPPVNTTPPTASGVPLDGQTLTATSGTWAGTSPITYAYQWFGCSLLTEECSDIAGATGSTYTAGPLDVGNALEVVVTASSKYGEASATSSRTSVVGALLPSNVKLPSIGGILNDGQILSVIDGVWNGTEPIALSYQWQLCNAAGEACKDINGAVATALSLISPYVGDTVRVIETATNGAGSVSAVSEPTSVVGALLPSNVSLPSITGSLIDGQLLSAVTGEWSGSGPLSFAYQWQVCNSAGEACKDISGALESTLALVSGDVGSTVRVIVTATNSAGSTEAVSAATSLIGALLPSNTSLPSIAGSLIDGQLLTAATGGWSGTGPISYGYQWQQCNASGEACKEISGATGGTLGLISGLVGSTVRVVVTATNSGGSTQATSAATSVVGALLPSNTSLPSIAGSLIDGQLLSAATGSWTGTGPISYAYQWQQCDAKGESCKEINGATGGTLGLISGLVGSTVRVVVTATNSGGSTQATSAATSVIGALLPGNTSLPSIAGSLIDGQTLTAATGGWSGTAPISYSYQWQQCDAKGETCKEISGATGGTLGLISGLVGSTLRVVVTATNSGGSTQATSPATGLIGALLPGNTSLPSIAGSLIDGQTLTAANGSWSGTGPISYAYQWQQCDAKGETCKEISGATGGTLGLISGLVGSTLRVVVTATNSGGSTQATSAATSVIGALLPGNTSLPSIAGTLIDGQTLTATTGGWSGTAPISYGYQWQQCNAKGESCKEINGATGGTLGLISGLVGSTVRMIVTATNSGGSTQATSTATGLIGALLPGNTSLPSIGGTLIDGQTLTAASGGWSGTTPISYGYQWQQCNAKGESCKEINGATGGTLGLISGLVGSTVRVIVTATNAGGSTQATSAASGLIGALLPGDTSLPSIGGTLIDGQTLTAANGSWSGTAPISYSYQWQQCNAKGESCKEINGATAGTLGLISSLVGSTVRVVVTATNSGGSTQATSPATGLIAALLPGNTSLPSISGVAEDGQKMTGSNGSWSGTTPMSFGYQWQQCNAKGEECKAITKEGTGETLGVVSSLVKSTIRLVVTATNSGGSSQATSAPTSSVLAALPLNKVIPTVSGTLEVGKELLAHPETWTGTAPIKYTYQWQLCGALGLVGECSNIAGATEEKFLLGLLDAALTLRVGVTAHNERGASETVYSKVTGLVAPLKLSPTKGAAGTNVVLQGAGVSTAKTVNFGSQEVTPEVKSPTEVVAEAPPGSGTVPVTVSTSEGTTHETPSDQFTYSP